MNQNLFNKKIWHHTIYLKGMKDSIQTKAMHKKCQTRSIYVYKLKINLYIPGNIPSYSRQYGEFN